MKLTQRQREFLKWIAQDEAVTVETIRDMHTRRCGPKRVLEMLGRLEKAGLLGRALLYPVFSTQSKRYWYLTRKGAKEVGEECAYGDPTPVRAQQLCIQYGRPGKGFTDAQQSTLLLLSEMKQLTTEQLNEYLFPDKSRVLTLQTLARLRRQNYLNSHRLKQSQQLYWSLTERGAEVVNQPFGSHFRRMPSPGTLASRKQKLAARKQVEAAGWIFVDSTSNNHHPEATPKLILQRSILTLERDTLAELMRAGKPLAEYKHRLERANRGDTGLTVPESIPDHVAYVPGSPKRTAVIILNPPYPSENFWLRKPRLKETEWHTSPESRVERYRRFAEVLPVLVVAEDEDTLLKVSELVAGTGYEPVLLHNLAEKLISLAQRSEVSAGKN